jgi:hypothetical protein
MSSADKALRGYRQALGLLKAGFTTLRSAGDADSQYPSFALRRAIDAGLLEGAVRLCFVLWLRVDVRQGRGYVVLVTTLGTLTAAVSRVHPLSGASVARQVGTGLCMHTQQQLEQQHSAHPACAQLVILTPFPQGGGGDINFLNPEAQKVNGGGA